MTHYLPYTEQHSIQEVQVALHLQRELAEGHIASARLAVEPSIKELLPRAAEMRGGSVTVDMSADGAQVRAGSVEASLVGLQYSRVRGDGTPAQILELGNNSLSVKILEYDGWDRVRNDITKYLTTVAPHLPLEDNPVLATSLNFTDRYTFVGDAKDACAELLFRENAKYITAHSFSAGPLWHCHSGWFEDIAPTGRTLNRLNIGSSIIDMAPTVTIEHQATVQFAVPRQSLDRLFEHPEQGPTVVELLDSLHDKNKDVLTALLLPEMLTKIGIQA